MTDTITEDAGRFLVTGVCAAALCDLGFGVETLRGFALLARTAGLLGHLAEVTRRPIGLDVYRDVNRATDYVAPRSDY